MAARTLLLPLLPPEVLVLVLLAAWLAACTGDVVARVMTMHDATSCA